VLGHAVNEEILTHAYRQCSSIVRFLTRDWPGTEELSVWLQSADASSPAEWTRLKSYQINCGRNMQKKKTKHTENVSSPLHILRQRMIKPTTWTHDTKITL
jgi:hypothetical protein